jgi:hypothetical protein
MIARSNLNARIRKRIWAFGFALGGFGTRIVLDLIMVHVMAKEKSYGY